MKNTRGKQKILLVDGDGERRRQMTEVLQSVFHVIPAFDGEMAVDVLHSRQDFAAIVLQCRLFDFSGFDVMGFLHTNRSLVGIPVIAMGGAEDELKALSLGAVAFVQQPKEPYLISYQIQNLVGLVWSDRDCDMLTGVLQWEPFLQKCRDILEQSERERRPEQWAMVFLNVDRFKVFNDLFGRTMGDQLLRNLAARLIVMKGVHCVGRVGGDRFVLLCRMEELELGRFRQLGPELMRRLHLKYGLHICCGIYEIDDLTIPVGEICDRAQIAQETISGRSDQSVVLYDEELRRSLRWEQEVVSQMYEALEQGQFQAYLQPIFSLSGNAPVSAEALVRWIHPGRGVIPPNQFIPIFERNGFITRLDQYIWEKVFQYLAEFKAEGYPDLTITANMSRLDIYNTDVCNQLTSLAKKYDVSPSAFRIEVTESAYMDDPQQLLDMTKQLNAAGFAVLIDDFGSGYSSLNMLMDMPVSTLKLDMSLVRSVGSDERANCVVNSILRMAKWLEMGVVAEGVETQAQIDYLRAIGCDRVQGYYFSRPIPKWEFLRLLENYRDTSVREKPPVFDRSADTGEVWGAVTAYDRMMRGRMDAAALYEQSGDMAEVLCVNDSYYRLMESSPELLFRSSQLATAWLMEEDRPLFLQALDAAAQTGERQELVVRRYMDVDRTKSLMVSVCYMGRKDNRKLFLALFRDISLLKLTLSAERIQETVSAPAAPPRALGCGSCRKVLIVEDNQVNRLVLRKILSQDYSILEAPNGKVGLDMLHSEEHIAAVLLDIIMPIMDGYEFLRKKTQDPSLRGIPVLVLSQSESRDSEEKTIRMGASGFVRKPYDPENLRKTLDALVKDN
ncbi:Chemotaxis response regulator protein-glutamate methylesterase [anaerobic digester metagenome]